MAITIKKPKLNLDSFVRFFINLGRYTISQLFVLLIILFCVNYISLKYFVRYDLTDTGKYSLDEATKSTLDKLEDDLTLKIFFSDNIPPELRVPNETGPYLARVPDDIKDIYDEYARYSKGKVKVEKMDPSGNEDHKNEALEVGIPELEYPVVSEAQDTYGIAKGFLGIGIFYQDKSELLPVVTNTNTLEYDTTLTIRRILNEELPKIGFLSGHGEKSLFTNYTQLNEGLSEQFVTETVTIENGEPISQDIKVLVVPGPTEEFTQRELFEIDQFIMGGGRVIFLVESHNIDFTSEYAQKIQSNYKQLLENFGITYTDSSMVLDQSYSPFLANGIFPLEYPFWVRVLRENFDNSHPTVSGLESIVLNWATTLGFGEAKEGREDTVILTTTEDAWLKTGETVFFGLDQDFTPGDSSKFNLAEIVYGKQESMFKGKEIPEVENDSRTDEERYNETENALIVAIADSDFLIDQYIYDNEGAAAFFVNLLDWMASGEDLINLRAKGITDRPLEPLKNNEKNIIKVSNIIVVPLVILIIGIAYNIFRNLRKSRF